MKMPSPYDTYTDIGLIGCLTIEELFNGSSYARCVLLDEEGFKRPVQNTDIQAWQDRFVGMPGRVLGKPAGYVEAHYFAEAIYAAARAKGVVR